MADIKKIEIDGTSYDIVGKGMPAGGAAGKVLKKASGNDYDTEWADESLDENPLPSGGTAGQVLAKNSGTDYDVKWVSHNNLPAGGLAGWALVKNSTTNYDAKWAATSLKITAEDGTGTAPSPSPFSPVQYFSVNDGGGTFEATASASSVAISASAVSMEFSTKTAADYADSLESVFGTTLSAVFAVDLHFEDSSYNEVKPYGTFEYTIKSAYLAAVNDPCVVCVTDDGQLFASKGYISDTNTIAFSSSHVGVFVVTDIASLNMADMIVNVTATRLYAAEDAGYPISVEYGGVCYYAETLRGAYGIYRNGLDLLHLILPVSGTTGQGYLETNAEKYNTLPAGGTAGQVLKKINDNNYAVEWASDNDHIPLGGNAGQVLKKASSANFDVYWGNEAGGAGGNGIPSGGTTGQVLAKADDGDYNVEWVNAGGGGGGSTEIEWVTYGTSTSAEIEAAYQAEKICAVIYNNRVYLLSLRSSATSHMFMSATYATMYTVSCDSDTWSNNYRAIPTAYTSTPSALGTASAGSASTWARGDHVHAMPSASDVGAYALPSGGIPATDLASAVQTSLGKADTALQSAPVTSVNGQTGAVVLSIPSTAADVGAAPAITEVAISTAGAVTQALDPGKLYHFTGALTALTITLNAAASGQIAQYHFDFDSGSTAPTLTLPNTVTMPSGFAVEANTHYEIDILNGYGVVSAWATS